ncbi:MAG: UPF0164 family protein [Calditrichaeota bacterium]|nr:UPF0164 family protein [Calditrichota bacterium]
MGWKKVIWPLAVIFLMIQFLYGQDFEIDKSILNEAAVGARAAGMGRAFTALANDANALDWNPAGLALFHKSSAIVASSFDFGKINIIPPANLLNSKKKYQGRENGSFKLNYIGFTFPLQAQSLEITSSIVIRNITDLNEHPIWTTIDESKDTQWDIKEDRSGGLFALATGVGIKVLDNVSLGTTLNFLTGNHDYKNTDVLKTMDSDLEDWYEWKNKFSGFSVDFGFIWNISKLITVGSRLTFPYTINYARIEYSNSNTVPQGGSAQAKFDAHVKKPLHASYGLALNLSPDLIFAFDYVYRPWKKITSYVRKNEEGTFTTEDWSFANANAFRMGIEFIVNSGNTRIPFRLGFFTSPEQIFEFNVTKPDQKGNQVTSHYLTGGFGFGNDNIVFNLAIDYKVMQYKADYLGLLTPFELQRSRFQATFGLEFML